MEVYNQKKQAEIFDQILKERLDTVLNYAMQKSGIDCWLIVSKEYCEDPMFKLLTPAMFLTARRISIILFYYNGQTVEKYCCNMTDELLESIYTNIYTDRSKDQFAVLNEFLLKINPQKIGIDVSSDYAYFDGLSKGMYDLLMEKMNKELTDRFVSAQSLGILYSERRCQKELDYYPHIMDTAIAIIEEAFSSSFIKPSVTTTDDVEWFMKEKMKTAGIDFWFSPDVNLQRKGCKNPMMNGDTVIEKGDLLHCDFGISYLGLNTDTQRLAYVLEDGQLEIPLDIIEGYQENMKFHEIVRNSFQLNRKGNEIFAIAIKEAEKQNIKAMLYTHPLGQFGHAPGPTIGLFSKQGNVYPAGELEVHDNTVYALELNTRHYSQTFGSEIFFFTEESVLFKDGKLNYLNRPKGIYII